MLSTAKIETYLSNRLFTIAAILALLLECRSESTNQLPRINAWQVTSNHQWQLFYAPYPAAQKYSIIARDHLTGTSYEATNGTQKAFEWQGAANSSNAFYQLAVVLMPSNAQLASIALNRLAYGPTPDELERVLLKTNAIGPDAFIQEQLHPEGISEVIDSFTTETINTNVWRYATATGTGSGSTLYLYLSAIGELYIDDIKLVSGFNAEQGANLLQNGDFESALTGPWQVFSNFVDSGISTVAYHNGSRSLRLVARGTGTGQSNSVWQVITPSLSSSAYYTLSYWYLPANNRSTLTARLSGSGISSTPDTSAPGLYSRLQNANAGLSDLRAWFCLHAVNANRQLLEILTQFLENHFVTQHSKSVTFFDSYYDDSSLMDRLAANLEYREIERWRQALLKPSCTFQDLLTISAESPAMIIYLDTVNSRGNGSNIANENYARELLELFTFGVDNGYEQRDITEMSRAWTGWSVNIVDASMAGNPLATRTTNVFPGVTTNLTTVSNLLGVWAFNYKPANHNTNSKTMFYERDANGSPISPKTVPARFGAPWAGRSYGLVIPSRNSTAGLQDGYDILSHLANQPFAQEYISVKLCRLFVHDDFNIGYDFTRPDLSAEARLVKACMLAWENSSPKGKIRDVLQTIFNSELFRSQDCAFQKVKTPLEFAASTIRALRSRNTNNTDTASTDGYAFSTPLNRMGTMLLFERADPDGYPETAPGWISAGTLAERLRFVESVLIAPGQTGKDDAGANNLANPVALLRLKLPSSAWTNAEIVTDYFLNLLFPGEGAGNLSSYRSAAIQFLNTADNGVTSSPLSTLSMSGSPSAYEVRVRGMVAMLMTFPRFQEQ